MGGDVRRSRRGVYYDLEKSPYEFTSPYGDSFKFSSKKKLEIYTRDVVKEVERVEKTFDRNGLSSFVPEEVQTLVKRYVYAAFYASAER